MSRTSPDAGIDRAAFIGRVSAALGRRAAVAPATPPPAVDEATVRVTGRSDDLASVFAGRAAQTGMTVHRVRSAAVPDHVAQLLAGLGARRIAMATVPALAAIESRLRAAGMEIVGPMGPGGMEPLYETDAGITDVQAAIAESGTLVCWAGPSRGRGLSLVPPVHIAVVRRSDIVADLIDYMPRHAGPIPSSVVLITGPSKTADIEGVLITGVHGPREVHIVLVEDT